MRSWRSSEVRRLRAALAAALCAAAYAVSSCTEAPAQEHAPLSMRVATSPQAATAESYVELEIGTFKKYVLDVTIEARAKGAGSAVAGIVVSKAADVGEADIIALCAAAEHGIPLSLLAPSNVYFPTSAAINVLTVAANSPVRSAKDLDGKVVAAPSLEGPARVS